MSKSTVISAAFVERLSVALYVSTNELAVYRDSLWNGAGDGKGNIRNQEDRLEIEHLDAIIKTNRSLMRMQTTDTDRTA